MNKINRNPYIGDVEEAHLFHSGRKPVDKADIDKALDMIRGDILLNRLQPSNVLDIWEYGLSVYMGGK